MHLGSQRHLLGSEQLVKLFPIARDLKDLATFVEQIWILMNHDEPWHLLNLPSHVGNFSDVLTFESCSLRPWSPWLLSRTAEKTQPQSVKALDAMQKSVFFYNADALSWIYGWSNIRLSWGSMEKNGKELWRIGLWIAHRTVLHLPWPVPVDPLQLWPVVSCYTYRWESQLFFLWVTLKAHEFDQSKSDTIWCRLFKWDWRRLCTELRLLLPLLGLR